MTNIKQWRKKNNVTQIELAKETGVSLTTIQLWERAVTTPNEENLEKLQNAMRALEVK